MPYFEHNEISLYYELHGEGFPVLLFAPGGMRSAVSFWKTSQFNPITELSAHFRVIAMDQRNAGQSTAPVCGDDGWHSYTADHIALLDHLGVERTHLLGGCIGGPYSLGLIKSAPGRVTAAVLQQSIGFNDNRKLFHEIFQTWAEAIKGDHPEADESAWRSFRSNMFDGDFDFNVGREFVRQCEVPLLVLMGDDGYHPQTTSREIAKLAPNATLVENWKSPQKDGTIGRVVKFLKANTPT